MVYPTDKEQQEIISHVHTAEISQAMERRKATWDEMLEQLPESGPRIQAPLPEDWRAGVSPANVKLTEDAAKKYDIPPELLARLFHRESSYNTTAYNRGHKGIPQMGDAELRSVGVNPDTFLQASAETQINAGAAYLAKQYGTFRNWPHAVAAYHNGRKSIEDWVAGAGPGYESEDEVRKPYVSYSGDLRVLTSPEEIANSRNVMGQWEELRKQLPYIFLGNANRYDKAKTP
jgi:soluble lytic murein transglycosylase-like protein